MTEKVLGRVGVSLADQYDVKGSRAGVEELDVTEVKAVHELGATMFSERFSTRIMEVTSGAIAQSLTFNAAIDPADVLQNMPQGVIRILGVTVLVSAVRVSRVQLSIRDNALDRDMIFWMWRDVTDLSDNQIVDDGSGLQIVLQPINPPWGLPTVMAGTEQPFFTPSFVLRGTTTAFGAGTATVTARILIAFAASEGLSSFGVPVPSW